MLLYFLPFVVNHEIGEARNGVPAEGAHVAEADQGAVLDVGYNTTAEA